MKLDKAYSTHYGIGATLNFKEKPEPKIRKRFVIAKELLQIQYQHYFNFTTSDNDPTQYWIIFPDVQKIQQKNYGVNFNLFINLPTLKVEYPLNLT